MGLDNLLGFEPRLEINVDFYELGGCSILQNVSEFFS